MTGLQWPVRGAARSSKQRTPGGSSGTGRVEGVACGCGEPHRPPVGPRTRPRRGSGVPRLFPGTDRQTKPRSNPVGNPLRPMGGYLVPEPAARAGAVVRGPSVRGPTGCPGTVGCAWRRNHGSQADTTPQRGERLSCLSPACRRRGPTQPGGQPAGCSGRSGRRHPACPATGDRGVAPGVASGPEWAFPLPLVDGLRVDVLRVHPRPGRSGRQPRPTDRALLRRWQWSPRRRVDRRPAPPRRAWALSEAWRIAFGSGRLTGPDAGPMEALRTTRSSPVGGSPNDQSPDR
jgi:hypothetical protein